jgi:hypothetical protein
MLLSSQAKVFTAYFPLVYRHCITPPIQHYIPACPLETKCRWELVSSEFVDTYQIVMSNYIVNTVLSPQSRDNYLIL